MEVEVQGVGVAVGLWVVSRRSWNEIEAVGVGVWDENSVTVKVMVSNTTIAVINAATNATITANHIFNVIVIIVTLLFLLFLIRLLFFLLLLLSLLLLLLQLQLSPNVTYSYHYR